MKRHEAREKALTIASVNIKSTHEKVRGQALAIFKALVDQRRSVDCALKAALECIELGGDIAATGLELLNYLLYRVDYYYKEASKHRD